VPHDALHDDHVAATYDDAHVPVPPPPDEPLDAAAEEPDTHPPQPTHRKVVLGTIEYHPVAYDVKKGPK